MNQEWWESRALLWWLDCRCLFAIPCLRTDCAACAGPCLFQSVVHFLVGHHLCLEMSNLDSYSLITLVDYVMYLKSYNLLWKDMGKSSTNHGGFYLANMEGYWAIHNFFVPSHRMIHECWTILATFDYNCCPQKSWLQTCNIKSYQICYPGFSRKKHINHIKSAMKSYQIRLLSHDLP